MKSASRSSRGSELTAAAKPRIDNFAALMQAIKDILPYLLLFYGIDFVIWQMNPPGPNNDRNLILNMLFTSLFMVGFLAIGFFRARSRQKQAQLAPAQVYVVQQPVYMGAPPGYQLTPIPPPGQPGALPPQPPPPQQGANFPPYPGEAPPEARKRPPEGSS